ncbi:hypothetical protein EMMF5_005682 [Cystobasidiomycetes sp. EMM_F5]
MGFSFFKRDEARATPKDVYNWRMYASAAIASFAALMIGYDSAFIGTSISIQSFKDEFGLSTLSSADFATTSANIVSTYLCGAFLGCIVAFPLSWKYGRRITLQLASFIAVVGAVLNTCATGATGLSLIYSGRCLLGIAVGMSTNATPLYLAEIAPPSIRGALIGMYEVNWQVGGLVGFWINYGITQHIPYSRRQWLIPFAIQLVPAGMFFIGLFFLKESPRWLITKGRTEEAINNLVYLRKLPETSEYVSTEIREMQELHDRDVALVGNGFWAPFREFWTNKALLLRISITTTLFLWQNASGVNAINYYSPTIFKSLGIVGQSTSLFTTGLFGVVKTTFMAIWLLFLIDQVGRRRLLIFGSVMAAICHFFIGAYIAIDAPQTKVRTELPPAGIAAVFMFYLYVATYTVSWSGTPWAVGSEAFPGHVRGTAQMCTSASNWFWTIWITRFTPQMFNTMGFGVYIFFASMMVLSIPFVFFLVPETKNIPIEAMNDLWTGPHKVWRANSAVMASLRSKGAFGSEDGEEKESVRHVEV